MSERRFDFRFHPAFRVPLLMLGVTPATAFASVDDEGIAIRFGPWSLRTTIGNIRGGRVSGPYAWYRAIGARFSFSDHGLTFGTTTEAGACVLFDDPVPGLDPLHAARHPGLTVTLEDPGGFLGEIQRRGAVFLTS